MDFSVYQSATGRTWAGLSGNDAINYLTLGLASEAGEVAGKVKKALRDEGGVFSEERVAALMSEIGDVVWYCARLAEEFGVDFNEVARGNLSKLEGRLLAGTLSGDGDNR